MTERARCGGGCGGAVAVGSGGVTAGTMGGGGVTAGTIGGGEGPTPEGQCWAWQVEQQNLNEGTWVDGNHYLVTVRLVLVT